MYGNYNGWGYEGMMGGFGGGIMMILFWGAVIYFIIWLIQNNKTNDKSQKKALDILKERYAKSEIDKKEFEEKKKDLTNQKHELLSKKQLNITFEEAINKTKAEVVKEGFGILTEIDVKATLKKKLGVDYDNYIILGACNPPFAHKAIQAEKEIGLLLPCNIIVYEDKNQVFVSAILPTVGMSMVDNPLLINIAKEVEVKLLKAIENI